jgi:hypothetical protein
MMELSIMGSECPQLPKRSYLGIGKDNRGCSLLEL